MRKDDPATDALIEWIILHKASVLDGMTRREQAEFTKLFGEFRGLKSSTTDTSGAPDE